jgi:hypothetical protein
VANQPAGVVKVRPFTVTNDAPPHDALRVVFAPRCA